MTSKPAAEASKANRSAPQECYVYITLPGQTKAVIAGRYSLSTDRSGTALGNFVYGRSYLSRSDAVEIDPIGLKLEARIFQTTINSGVFGGIRDASPDYWGRLIVQRALKRSAVTEVEYLLEFADDRAGALGFGRGVQPPAPLRKFNKTIDLERLQAIADDLDEGKTSDEEEAAQIARLLLLGSSMGGQRPKAVVEDARGLWISKFNKASDRWNVARVEHAMLTLARACGIKAAISRVERVGSRDVLLVKRFDRTKTKARAYLRSRMISGLTMLGLDESDKTNFSYPALAEALRKISGTPKKDAHELFRRMCFNALIGNTDDHPRNYAAIAKDRVLGAITRL